MRPNPRAIQDPPRFRAVLTQHRSLSPRGFVLLMVLLGGVSFVTGVAFAMIGAWPVLGFFGLDVAIVYLAFRLNYRDARAFEVVEVTTDALTLTTVDRRGRAQAAVFNPYWARVLLREWPDGSAELRITSHGREHAFGHVLGHDERREFADVLRRALAVARGA